MSEATEKKKRSPLERFIVWGLIAALLVVVLIEFLASKNFNAAGEYLETSIGKRPTLDEVKANCSGASFGTKQKDKLGTEEVELSFFSIFKSADYKLRLQFLDVPDNASDEQRADMTAGGGRIADYYNPAGMAAVKEEVARQADEAHATDAEDAGNTEGEHDSMKSNPGMGSSEGSPSEGSETPAVEEPGEGVPQEGTNADKNEGPPIEE